MARSSSNYSGRAITWNDVLDDQNAEEAPCGACKGRGTDRHGDDCTACDGYGVQI